MVNSLLLAHLIRKKSVATRSLYILWAFAIPLICFIRDVDLIQGHDVICKSSLVAQDTVLIFLDFVVPDEECLVFSRFIEVVNVWNVVIMVAAIVDMRIYEGRKGIL